MKKIFNVIWAIFIFILIILVPMIAILYSPAFASFFSVYSNYLGAIIGAFVTLVAVSFTIVHERKQYQEQNVLSYKPRFSVTAIPIKEISSIECDKSCQKVQSSIILYNPEKRNLSTRKIDAYKIGIWIRNIGLGNAINVSMIPYTLEESAQFSDYIIRESILKDEIIKIIIPISLADTSAIGNEQTIEFKIMFDDLLENHYSQLCHFYVVGIKSSASSSSSNKDSYYVEIKGISSEPPKLRGIKEMAHSSNVKSK